MIVSAPAKINLTLEITGVEANGYHTLDTIFSWLELEDTLQFTSAASTILTMEGEEVDVASIPTGPENLICRALSALEQFVERQLPTHIFVRKRIPAGGGLGGGSANAAATLFGLNALHNLNLSRAQLQTIACSLGADVAFGLVGGLARGRRYGDELESLSSVQSLAERELLLVMPPFGCPTPQVYEMWDREPSHVARGASERFLLARGTEQRFRAIANDLESAAFRLHPLLAKVKQKMMEIGLDGVCLSGSGSTLFGFLPTGQTSASVGQGLSEFGVRVKSTRLKESTRYEFVS